MNLQLDVPIFFKKDDDYSDLFCGIIDAQNEECCTSKIDDGYMSRSLHEFTHGYIILGETEEENRRYRGYEYTLKAFVIFEYKNYKHLGGTIKGKAICCNPKNRGYGRILLDSIKNLACENDIRRWIIHALSFEKLILYYMGFGFEKYRKEDVPDGIRKTILMVMRFDNMEDLYDYDNSDDESCFEKPDLKEQHESEDSVEEYNSISDALYKLNIYDY